MGLCREVIGRSTRLFPIISQRRSHHADSRVNLEDNLASVLIQCTSSFDNESSYLQRLSMKRQSLTEGAFLANTIV